MTTRVELLREGTAALSAAGIDAASREARLLLRWASGLDASALGVRLSEDASDCEIARWAAALARRAAREPLSHITGERLFWGRAFKVTPDVLDPRPETEVLVDAAIRTGPFARVLDLGTGTGCLLLSLLGEWPTATGVGTDISVAALSVARENAELQDVASRAAFLQSDWFDQVTGCFDLIVSNPPYIAAHEMVDLAPEVRDHEPDLALTPGDDGLAAYRTIADRVRDVLSPGGVVMVEIGPTQALEVSELLARGGVTVSAILPDLDQRPRVVVARR